MKKRYLFLGIICCVMLLALTGCGNKKAITTNEFSNIAKNNGLEIFDTTDQYAGYIEEGLIAYKEDEWQIEFYILENDEKAISMFDTNKENFEESKGTSSTELSTTLGNYSTYELKSNGYFMYVARVDNTLLFVHVEDDYEDNVKTIIKELGY